MSHVRSIKPNCLTLVTRPLALSAFAVSLWLTISAPPASASDRYDQRVLTKLQSGTVHLQAGELDAARLDFDEAIRLDGNCYQALNNVGLCYMRQGQLDKAAEQFRAAIKINSNYVGSLNNLGIVNYLQGHYDEAAIFYERALALAHDRDAEIHTNLANALRDKGDYPGAIDHYRQSVKLQPDYAPAYNNLGLTLMFLHREAEGAVEVTKAIKLKPTYSEAYYNLGLIRKELKQTAEAKAAFENSLKYETNPTYAEATRKILREMSTPRNAEEHLSRGYDLLESNNWQGAESEFRAAVKLAPENALAWNNLGLALAQQNKTREAIADYNKAISLKNGSFSAAHFNLGQALRSSGDRSGAEKALRQAIKDNNGTHAYAHVALGLLLKERGDLKAAVQNYKLAILQSGDTLPVVHFNLAIALERLDSTREAVREYQIYLSQSPRGLNAENARQRLRRLGVDM